MDLQTIYLNIIDKLKEGKRPIVSLDDTLVAEIKHIWQESLEVLNYGTAKAEAIALAEEQLRKIFCILGHTHTSSKEFNELIILTLKNISQSEILVYALGVSHKQMIAESFKSGVILPQEFFSVLKNILAHPSPEVKEWGLRTVDALGPLGTRLKDDVLKMKTTPFFNFKQFFNPHIKSTHELISYLESEWKKWK